MGLSFILIDPIHTNLTCTVFLTIAFFESSALGHQCQLKKEIGLEQEFNFIYTKGSYSGVKMARCSHCQAGKRKTVNHNTE